MKLRWQGSSSSPGGNAAHSTSSRDIEVRYIVTPPSATADANGSRANRRRWLLRIGWKPIAIIGAAALAAIGAAIPHYINHKRHPPLPGLTTQLNDEISAASKSGYDVVGSVHVIQFRAAGRPSEVIVLRPFRINDGRSDELRIYDTIGEGADERLKLSLRFRPKPTPRTSRALAGDAAGTPRAYSIRLRLFKNFDAQPGNELIADVSEAGIKPIWPRPLYVYWDAASQRFAVRGLLSPSTTRMKSMRQVISPQYLTATDAYARALRRYVYAQPSTITDAAGGVPPIKAYAVEAYVLKTESLHDPRGATGGGLALTAGYVVSSSGFGAPTRLQAVTWHIDLRQYPAAAKASFAIRRVLFVGPKNWSHLESLLVRARN
jgi:hypothetical protein